MKTIFSNDLSDAEIERLAILAEECAETIHIIGKILRHGYESFNPNDSRQEVNRWLLEKELGDIRCIIQMMADEDDIDQESIDINMLEKRKSIKEYLHHQPD